jgi:phage tail sheath protein FI
MPPYLSPGVYVKEVPSAVKAIAGVSTSTAGFIGIVPDALVIPVELVTDRTIGTGNGTQKDFNLPVEHYPVQTTAGSFQIKVNGNPDNNARLNLNDTAPATVTFSTAPANEVRITADYLVIRNLTPVTAGEVKLCTNFSEYKTFFSDFSTDPDHRNLTHAVFGFFNNGGSRCYVARVKTKTDIAAIQAVLTQFEAIDEIAIVAAPGIHDKSVWIDIDTHCRQRTQDRFAIFDSPEVVGTAGNLDTRLLDPTNTTNILPARSDFAAFYFPWIQVFDPATKIQNPTGDGLVFVPPSGHIAGIYARVDTQRGVHKAPANEPVLGALGLKYRISKGQQDGLNPQGVNCIRDLNGNIRVWGARTLGGDANQDLKYINVRRTLLFLRESIDEGMQFVVFEPNTPALWQKIVRNVSAFLTNVWRSGALFGTTPQQAFFVKCDKELNTSEERELGRVITEIGVALVRPAEFVIFRLSQFTAPGS